LTPHRVGTTIEVLLNACQGGVQAGETARLAGALLDALRRGDADVGQRLVCQPARRRLLRERQRAIGRDAPLAETQPEYATAALYVRGEERRVADFALDKEPLRVPPVRDVGGPVSQLGIDDLISRRRELRETLRALRDPSRAYTGVVLTGLGGVGKSAIAGPRDT
jgi:hypothetical protein